MKASKKINKKYWYFKKWSVWAIIIASLPPNKKISSIITEIYKSLSRNKFDFYDSESIILSYLWFWIDDLKRQLEEDSTLPLLKKIITKILEKVSSCSEKWKIKEITGKKVSAII